MKLLRIALLASLAGLAAVPTAEARNRGGRTTVITQAAPTVDVGTALLLGLLGQGSGGLTTGFGLAGLSTGGCNNGLSSLGLVSPSTVIIDQGRGRRHHRAGRVRGGGGGGGVPLPALD